MRRLFYSMILIFFALPISARFITNAVIDPRIDGVFSSLEYTYMQELKDMKLGYALSKDSQSLYFALQAPTKGWISIGLGSNRMQGAHIVIGYDTLSNQTISEETGKGHGHSPSIDKIVQNQMVKERAGTTTLEFSIPSTLSIVGRELQLIVAYGSKDDLKSKHTKYASYTIKAEQ